MPKAEASGVPDTTAELGMERSRWDGAWTRRLAALGVLLVVWHALVRSYTREQFADADAYDYAHMGSELAAGHGFTTRQAFPRHLVWFAEHGQLDRERWPNLYRYPLPIVLQAVAVSLLEDAQTAAVLRSWALWGVAGVFAFLLLTRFLAAPLALVGTFLLLADLDLWADALSGMVESQATALVLVLAWLLTGPLERRRELVGLGLVTGALYLTKHQYAPVAALVPLALWSRRPGRRVLRDLVPYGTALLVVLAPWLARNAALTGDPLFSFSMSRNLVLGTSELGSDVEMRLDEPGDMGALLAKHGEAVGAKFRRNLGYVLRGYVVVGSAFYSWVATAVLLALPLMLVLVRRSGARAGPLLSLTVFSAGLVVLGALGLAASFSVVRFGYPLRPVLGGTAVLLVASFLGVTRGATPRLRAAKALFAGLALVGGARGWHALYTEPTLFGELRTYGFDPCGRISERTEADAVIASDVSYELAMHTERRTLRLPLEPADLLRIDDELLPVSYVHLSPAIDVAGKRTSPPRGIFVRYPHYGAFTRTEAFRARWELLELLPDGSRLYARRAR